MIKVTREAKSGRPFKLSENEVDELVAMYNEGIKVSQIADRYEVSAPTVRRYIKIRREDCGSINK